jgi:hypothetical protein
MELHNLYFSPNIIRMIKLKRIRLARHVARKGRRGLHIGYRWKSQKERDHYEDLNIGGWTTLKGVLRERE